TEVTIECVEDRFARFADRGPTQSADRERCEVAVRVRVEHAGTRSGVAEARASSASLDVDDARDACERAVEIARESRPADSSIAPGGPVDVRESAADPMARAHDFRVKARWIERALEACAEHDLTPAGIAQTTACRRTLCNSAGRVVHGGASRASFALTAGVGVG